MNLCSVPSSEEEIKVLSERKHNPVWSVRVCSVRVCGVRMCGVWNVRVWDVRMWCDNVV